MTDTAPPVTGVTAYLSSSDAGAAAEFYKKAFAAQEVARMPAQDGKRLMHCHLLINGGALLMSDCFPEHGYAFKEPAGVTLHLQVGDAQAWWDRAVAAGAQVIMPMDKQFWGDRYGQLRDPFGVTWSIGGPAE
jgi:PhnB protein